MGAERAGANWIGRQIGSEGFTQTPSELPDEMHVKGEEIGPGVFRVQDKVARDKARPDLKVLSGGKSELKPPVDPEVLRKALKNPAGGNTQGGNSTSSRMHRKRGL